MIKTIGILGVGAVGSYFVYGLSENWKENLWVIADGERKSRLEQQGMSINGETVRCMVKTPEEAKGVDLLLVAVKYGALKEILPMVKTMVGEHTIVMSLLNGVDSEQILGDAVGMEHMVHSYMKISSERRGGKVYFDPEKTQGLYYGAVNREDEKKVAAVEEALQKSCLHTTKVSDILEQIWVKYMLNISKNIPQAMINCGYIGYQNSEHVEKISDMLYEEVKAVAKAKGIDLSKYPNDYGISLSPNARFSTLQDLDEKRHTEIDMFCGTLCKIGKELGVATPYNEMAFHIVKALEERNDGLFEVV